MEKAQAMVLLSVLMYLRKANYLSMSYVGGDLEAL